MAKKREKEKAKESKQDKTNKKSKQPDLRIAASGSSYADGTPLDRVQYLEAKLILKPDRFTSVQSFRDFGKIMQRTAKKVGVGFIEDSKAGLRPEIREIVFGDTPDFRLYNNAFILRRRVAYGVWFPGGGSGNRLQSSVTPMKQAATAMDVRPKIAGRPAIKFCAEALPLKDQVGGYRILYSHNCQFGLSQVHDADSRPQLLRL